MKGSGYFQEISAGAISGAMPECIAIIINAGNAGTLVPYLHKMYSAREYTVFSVNTSFEKLPQVLARCHEAGIPAIVNCGGELPAPSALLPEGEPYQAAVISAGSYGELSENGGDIISYVLNDKYAAGASCIGFQGYYFSPCKLSVLRNRYFEQMRLGTIRDNIALAEPLLRDTSHVFVDFNSIRHCDYPLEGNPHPNGLYAEEICQLARYIGFGMQLKSVFLYSTPSADRENPLCSTLASEFIWHLCEAIACNIAEFPADNPDDDRFIRKIISLGDNGEEMVFINSSATDRWWMEILSPAHKEPIYVPCSINDYRAACSGEVPTRWLFFYQKHTIL